MHTQLFSIDRMFAGISEEHLLNERRHAPRAERRVFIVVAFSVCAFFKKEIRNVHVQR